MARPAAIEPTSAARSAGAAGRPARRGPLAPPARPCAAPRAAAPRRRRRRPLAPALADADGSARAPITRASSAACARCPRASGVSRPASAGWAASARGRTRRPARAPRPARRAAGPAPAAARRDRVEEAAAGQGVPDQRRRRDRAPAAPAAPGACRLTLGRGPRPHPRRSPARIARACAVRPLTCALVQIRCGGDRPERRAARYALRSRRAQSPGGVLAWFRGDVSRASTRRGWPDDAAWSRQRGRHAATGRPRPARPPSRGPPAAPRVDLAARRARLRAVIEPVVSRRRLRPGGPDRLPGRPPARGAGDGRRRRRHQPRRRRRRVPGGLGRAGRRRGDRRRAARRGVPAGGQLARRGPAADPAAALAAQRRPAGQGQRASGT